MRLLLDARFELPVGHRVELKTVDPEIVLQGTWFPGAWGRG
jgi:hypothetical protein